MVDYLEILRLKHLGYSQRQIIGTVSCSSHTIKDTWEAAQELNLQWPMADELERQFTERSYKEMSFGDRMDLIVTSEWNRRQTNKLNRYVKAARFSVPSATIENIEYHEDRRLDKALITKLATCKYILDGRHVIINGESGNGKTYIACALGKVA